jgi:SAM-dependent methyltransferase
MTANYTRRHDLFVDAGYSDPHTAIASIVEQARAIGLESAGAQLSVEEALERATNALEPTLSPAHRSMLDGAVEWLFERNGDLAALLWLAGRLAPPSPQAPVPAMVFGLGRRLWLANRRVEAAALLRFFAQLDFDWGALYAQQGVAYGFFSPRDPNPLVWKLLEHAERRLETHGDSERLRVLELGCGIGNDAAGFLQCPLVDSYEGIDISAAALERQRERTEPARTSRPEVLYRLSRGDLLPMLRARVSESAVRPNVIYSYSSLHYFNSTELLEIIELVRQLLPARRGLFAFGIKGKGSIWDGQGIPIYRPDVWLNHDGQSRWFPSRRALDSLLDRKGFELRLHEVHEHWGYSEAGKVDFFHYVICSPRAADQPKGTRPRRARPRDTEAR